MRARDDAQGPVFDTTVIDVDSDRQERFEQLWRRLNEMLAFLLRPDTE